MHYVLHAELNATVPQRRKKAKHTEIKCTPPPSVMQGILRLSLCCYRLPPQVTPVALFAGDRG